MDKIKVLKLIFQDNLPENLQDYEPDDYQVSSYDESLIEVGSEEWLVLNEHEREDRWDENLQNYLDECILPDLPENMRSYFDEDKWKSDARLDGAGHCLSSYDGCEYETQYEGQWFYAYRVN